MASSKFNHPIERVHIYATLGIDVIQQAKNIPDGHVYFYMSSNSPTNRPSGCDWGGYMFFRSGNGVKILYLDGNHIASGSLNVETSTSITWHIT